MGETVKVVYPFRYRGIEEETWDLVIIEGWFEGIHAFIHEIRRTNKGVLIIFLCLDPDYPGMDVVRSFDVDIVATNSKELEKSLRFHSLPTDFVQLAADEEMMGVNNHTDFQNLSNSVVFVGSAGGLTTKSSLLPALRALKNENLVIYGYGWEISEEFKEYWRGVLPMDCLGEVYKNALAVIGATMDGQRAHGMINNRVFEVLSAGGLLIHDHFPSLQDMMDDRIFYYNDESSALNALASIKNMVWNSNASMISSPFT